MRTDASVENRMQKGAMDGPNQTGSPLAISPVTTHTTRQQDIHADYTPNNKNRVRDHLMRFSTGLPHCDFERIADRVTSMLSHSADLEEINDLAIQVCAGLIFEEPEYSRLAAKLLDDKIAREVWDAGIHCFSDSVKVGTDQGLIGPALAKMVESHAMSLDHTIDPIRSLQFEYFGLRTIYDRYLLKHPVTRRVVETPQYFFLRVACGLSENPAEAKAFYRMVSAFDFMPSSPTLFNSGTNHPQLSSCFLLDSPDDDLMAIYDKYREIAQLSKFAGGIGMAFHRIRSRGSLIKGTNGKSNGIIPWLKTLDSSVHAVNQGGKRKGAACVYLETWHADVEDFLELRDNTGDDARRAHNINLANWVPDLFMERVEQNAMWSLFDPKELPDLPDLYGADFKKAYEAAETEGKAVRKVKARDLYGRMMRTLAETGNGWMTFKDASNLKCNQTGKSGKTVHLSNLCTEILEVTSNEEIAVCNLGSVNLSRHVGPNGFDFEKLEKTVKTAVTYLDRVIDLNFYPVEKAGTSNKSWRPIGLGIMGLQDAFFKMGYAFDSKEALGLSTQIQAAIYYSALDASCTLASENGAHPNFYMTRAAQGDLQFDLWKQKPVGDEEKWQKLRDRVGRFGLRNSLMIAVAPTATIASIVGCFEATEPQVSNLFKRETLSGEFLQVNRYLVQSLKDQGLWTPEVRAQIKDRNGSIQHIEEIPQKVRDQFRTAWEVSMKSLIDLAAARGPYIDQSQSLNLFIESPTIGKLSSMYHYAWKSGLKTTYYMRSRPATEINKFSAASKIEKTVGKKEVTTEEAVSCSLENPESCDSCQ